MSTTSGWSRDSGAAGRRLAAPLAATVLAAAVFVPAPALAATYDPTTDPYSMANTTLFAGAQAWWDAGFTGDGVDVALIDTGVSPVEGLATAGKLVYGPDLSLESQNPNLRHRDTNGHGTFTAGLIAGKDGTFDGPYSSAPASVYRGIAPDARIVSVKVGVADGGTDVSQVIAAINWVIQHKDENGLNIRVINLSYGTNSLQDARVDPLSYAVEQAWNQGIVVVAAAGDTGFQAVAGAPGLANPACNPYVIAVGGYDTMGTASTTDDVVGSWSARGAPLAHVRTADVVAVGSHLQGLRVPGSHLDASHPEGRLDSRYVRGSGTGQAAAIASGSVALILQRYPTFTPDQVKAFITANTTPIGADGRAMSLSEAAANEAASLFDRSGGFRHPQTWAAATGTGTLDGARGTDRLTDDGVVLAGERDIFGAPWDPAAMANAAAAGSGWSGGAWNGSTWSGNGWTADSWTGDEWSVNTWSGNSWTGSAWSSDVWSGHGWSGDTWSGNTWSGNTWSGTSWSGHTWSGNSWSGDTWSDGPWSVWSWD